MYWLVLAFVVIAGLAYALHTFERETPMSLEVKGLADTIRAAKVAISKASDAAARMQGSAGRLTDTLGQVEDMTNQLDAANADLQGAVGTLSNGGPPLDATPAPAHVSSPGLSVPAAVTRVQNANAT